jgi:fibronectin type 3 domain-containing protein
MWVNWKRFSFGAFLLASLSLLLVGCGDLSGSKTSQKTLTGVVSDSTTGLPADNVTVKAFAIDSHGVKGDVISSPASVQTGNNGKYTLRIPASYTGSVLVEAAPSGLSKLAKILFSSAPPVTLQALVPSTWINSPTIPPVMISFATNMVVKYITNSTTSTAMTADNIREATLVLETFFGANFAQTPPPSGDSGTVTSKAQQDLLVSIVALNSVAQTNSSSSTSFDTAVNQLVAALSSSTGLDGFADQIKVGIASAVTVLAGQGVLPLEYVPSADINTAISNAQFAPVDVQTKMADANPPAAPSALAVAQDSAHNNLLSPKSVALTWASSADAVGYLVYRTDASGGVQPVGSVDAPAAGSAPVFTDFTVVPNTSYTYQVVAYDWAGNLSAGSNVLAVSTPDFVNNVQDNVPPAAPVGLVCIGLNDHQVNLQWSQSTKITAGGLVVPAAQYVVYRDGQFIGSTTETSYIDLGVTQGTSYSYFVKAVDLNSNQSLASGILTVQTTAIHLNAPADPLVQGQASMLPVPEVILTWAIVDGADYYNVYRDGKLIATQIDGVKYVDSNVIPSDQNFTSSYKYVVTSVKVGTSGPLESTGQTSITATMPKSVAPTSDAPTAPFNLSVVSFTSNSVALLWTASTPAASSPLAGYDVLRQGPTDTKPVRIATVSNAGYTDTTASANTAYSYVVQGISASGVRSALSSPATVHTSVAADLQDVTPPAAPTGLALVGPTTSSTVSLQWTTSTESDLAGYRVYRDGSQVADVHLATNFTDITVAPGTTYSYSIKAYDNTGNVSLASDPLSATTLTATPNTFSISGRITQNGAGKSKVNLLAVSTTGNSSSKQVNTDDNGNYFFSEMARDSYTLTPVSDGITLYNPVSRTVTISNANITGIDFAAINTGGLIGGTTFPDGTVIGGITYPTGAVINGIYYPFATVIGGVTYPTGAVIGGIYYPNGVVIGGVSYPPGTIVGGIAFPTAAAAAGFQIPSGTVIGGVVYPTGSTSATIGYPTGVVYGGTTFPTGTVRAGVIYPTAGIVAGASFPTGSASGGISYPSGGVLAGVNYPQGTLIGGVYYPTGTVVINGVTYPTGVVVIGGVSYPVGGVIGGITYPSGVVIGGISYPAGTVVGGIAFPVGTVTSSFTVPSGTLIGGVIYPTGTVVNGVITPGGTAIGSITYPAGTVVGGILYPTGTVNAGLIYPTGTLTGSINYPNGTLLGGISYPYGATINGVFYPTATVINGVTYPTGAVIGGISYPNGVVIGGVSYPAGTIVGGVALPVGFLAADFAAPSGTVIGGVLYPYGTLSSGVSTPGGSASGSVAVPTGVAIGGVIYPVGAVSGGVDFAVGTSVAGLSYPDGSQLVGLNAPSSSLSSLLGYYYRVSGKVRLGSSTGTGLSGIVMSITGPANTIYNTTGITATNTTDIMGNYTFYVNTSATGGSYVITADPSAVSGHTFDSNPSATFTLSTTNVSVSDFIAH